MERYFFFGLLLVTFILSFLIFKPFWVILVLGISFSVVLYPFYEWLKERKIPNALASLLTVIFFTILLCGPLLGIGALVFEQSKGVYQSFTGNNDSFLILESVNTTVNKILPQGVTFDIHAKASEFVSYITSNIATIFSTTVSAFFSFILTLLIIFYFLKDGEEWKKMVIVLSPLSDTEDKKIIHRLREAILSVVMGNLLIAFTQGTLMGLGLWIFGIPNPAVWGTVAAFTSLIPTIGTAFISVPAIFFLFFIGATGQAVGLLVWAVIVVGMIDNFLSPMFIAGRTNISPLFILFAVLGGVSLLGPVGILMGPLTISLLYALIAIYRNEIKQNEQILSI